MKYTKKGKKFIFEKDGVHFSMTLEQVELMESLCKEIIKKENPIFACVVDGKDDPMDTCTWDDGNLHDCVYSGQGIKKKDCKYWQAI